jgi:GntR family transcriptional regulator, transcriptional repressor for pyruvate dehydrogenase complex
MKEHSIVSDETLFKALQARESAVDAVVNRFRELLMQRKLKPGDLLPSETALAENMGVSRGSVREAMKILTALGIVDIRRGDGTYVSGDIGRTLLDPLLLRLMMSGHDSRQLIEFREMIEFDVARAALRNRSPSSLDTLRQAIGQMDMAIHSGENLDEARWAEMDIAFHRALGKATGNVLIEQLYEFLLGFYQASIQRTYRHPNNAAKAFALHRGIFNALEQGVEAGVMEAVEKAVGTWAEQEDVEC